MLTEKEKAALVQVLSLAESHGLWTSPISQSPQFKDYVDGQYEAIQEVRRFLKKEGVLTLHEWTQRLAASQITD
jgi:hypothetical protein